MKRALVPAVALALPLTWIAIDPSGHPAAQGPTTISVIDVSGDLSSVLRSRGKAEIAERVRRMLELVRLTGFADRYPGQLSGGQQQRVAIARALAVEPRVLLLDEPLSNLDTKLRPEMRGEIKRLHADLGLTSIYVTHDQAEALSLSDRVVVLCDGRVIQAGTPAEIHDRPQTVFVADFMGYRNFFPLTVASDEGD